MELHQIFSLIAPKIAECQECGIHVNFEYSGHVDFYSFRIYPYGFEVKNPKPIDIYCFNSPSISDFLDTFFGTANNLIADLLIR